MESERVNTEHYEQSELFICHHNRCGQLWAADLPWHCFAMVRLNQH